VATVVQPATLLSVNSCSSLALLVKQITVEARRDAETVALAIG
jgi:hypothetical protein